MTGLLSTPDLDGHPLERGTRQRLEQAFQTDLSAITIHRGASAQRRAADLGADAFAVGTGIWFGRGRYQPTSASGLALLAHEVAHVIQQCSGQTSAAPGRADRPNAAVEPMEQAAHQAAAQFEAGLPIHRSLRGVRVREPVLALLQRHDSFEHRALGDVATADLRQMSTGGPQRTQLIEREIALQWLWHADPESVTKEQIQKQCPGIQVLRLAASGLLVTYGELNALPDYIATGEVADTVSKAVLLPILQFIRQESYVQFNRLLDRATNTPFQGAVFTPSQWAPGLVNILQESLAMDALTSALGVAGVDHYTALLGRNACHFAPFSWHRWQASFLISLDLAQRAHQASDPNERARLTHQAWLQQGYADHFLQDSFAAGHLVNKTLIMQWFVEWAAGQSLVPVFDWDTVKKMTAAAQPGLAGRALYDPTSPGGSNDPQTAEDQPTYRDRLRTTGLVAGQSGSLDAAYQDYFTFLSSMITQSASAAIHDYYNVNSLWVASKAHPTPYEVWGDDTLLSGRNGGDGVQATSEAAQISQQAVRDTLAGGATTVTAAAIRDRFPTQVQNSAGQLLDLQSWNDTQQQFCAAKIFPDLHDLVLRMTSPQILNLSRDQDLATRWSTSLPDARFTTTSVLQVGDRLYAGSNGFLFQLDLLTGRVLGSVRLVEAVGVGNYETRLASDGQTIFVGTHGYVYGVTISGFRLAWTADMAGAGYLVVDVLATQGRLFAGSNGYLFQLNPSSGKVDRTLLLGSSFGSGDYTMRLTSAGPLVVAGTHGWAYGVRISDFGKSWETSLPNAGYHPVEVLARGDQIFAGSNGYAFALDAASGKVRSALRVSDPVGVGDYTTTLAADDRMLYVGTHGYVYGVRLDNWSGSAWSANLAGNRYSMVNLASLNGQLLAGSYGYVFRIDPASGRVLRSVLIAAVAGVGEYETRLTFAPSAADAYVGVHGYAYRLSAVVDSSG